LIGDIVARSGWSDPFRVRHLGWWRQPAPQAAYS